MMICGIDKTGVDEVKMSIEDFLKRLDANDFAEGDTFWLEGWGFKVTGRRLEKTMYIR